MFAIILSLLSAPTFAYADATLPPVRVPEVVKEKWEDVSKAVGQGFEQARTKIDEAGREEIGQELKRKARAARDSSFGQAVADAASRLWVMAKQKTRGLAVSLDEKFHEKVLGENESSPKANRR